MNPKTPAELIQSAEQEKRRRASDAKQAFDWFLEQDGMVTFEYAAQKLSESADWEYGRAVEAVIGLTDDTLDPVQLVRADEKRWVGIVDFEVFDDEGGYGYELYDDTVGRRKEIVCARCVEIHDFVDPVFRAREGKGRHGTGCSYESMLDHLTEHYTQEHEHGPSSVDVAASLVSGTTIAGNTATHGGNLSSFSVTDFGVGALSDGQVLSNSGGSLSGVAQPNIDTVEVTTPSNITDASTITTPTIAYVGGYYNSYYVTSSGSDVWSRVSDGVVLETGLPDVFLNNTVSRYNFGDYLNLTPVIDSVSGNTGENIDATYDTDTFDGPRSMQFSGDGGDQDHILVGDGSVPSNLQLAEQENLCLFGAFKTSSSDGTILSVWSGSSRGFQLRVESSGVIGFYVRAQDSGNSDLVVGSTNVTDGVWHTATGVRDGPDANGMTVYVDGSEDGTSVSSNQGAGTFTASGDVRLAQEGSSGNRNLNGNVDVPAFVAAAPTATDISNLNSYYTA